MLFASLHRIRSTRPALWHVSRLTATATFAYLLALMIPAGMSRPVLAPLTALLVLQASLFQTIRSVMRKVLSVTVGVLVAVGVAEFIGFSWWQLALVIAGALGVGRVLRLGEDLLEVPISAMLIFSSVGTHAAATGRVMDTLIGAAAGLGGGLVFGAPRVRPARSAVGHLAGQVAGLLDRMAADLAGTERTDTERTDTERTGTERTGTELADTVQEGNGQESAEPADDLTGEAAQWLVQARALRDEIERVDDTLREAADSARLNPRALVRSSDATPVTMTTVALRGGLEALEHAALTLRGLARSVLDSAEIASECSPVRDRETRVQLASVLAKLGEAIRTYGRLVQLTPVGSESLESELAAELDEAHRLQDELADLLKPQATTGRPSEWPLRGEILAHVDRLRTGLNVETVHRASGPPVRRRRRSATGSGPKARSLRRVVSHPRTPRA
jgi:Aromatic acid exporter family member 1